MASILFLVPGLNKPSTRLRILCLESYIKESGHIVEFLEIPKNIIKRIKLLKYVKNFELGLDIIFLIDIFLNFFKQNGKNKKFKQIAINYLTYVTLVNFTNSGYFLFDIVATVPGLVTL